MRKEVATYVEYHLEDDIKVKISNIIQLLNDVNAEANQSGVGINIEDKFYTCRKDTSKTITISNTTQHNIVY